jgi:ATP-dependent Clp protease ATP-binding subunit ClpC
MFERFTDRSRHVVVRAKEEAALLGHGYIGTEHLMLALIHEESGAPAQVLAVRGVTLTAARNAVAEMSGPTHDEAPAGHILFSPRAKRILERALREALELKQTSIRPEHLLLAVTREADSAGAEVLDRLGGPLEELREQALDAARVASPDWALGEDAGYLTWPPVTGFARQIRSQAQALHELRLIMESIDRRLAAIERVLGISPDAEHEPPPGESEDPPQPETI